MCVTICNGNGLSFHFKYGEIDILWQPHHQSELITLVNTQMATTAKCSIYVHRRTLVIFGQSSVAKTLFDQMSISADYYSQTFQCFQYSQTFQRLYLPRSQHLCNLWHCHRHFLYKYLVSVLIRSFLISSFPSQVPRPTVGRETWIIYPQRPHMNNPKISRTISTSSMNTNKTTTSRFQRITSTAPARLSLHPPSLPLPTCFGWDIRTVDMYENTLEN